MNQAPVIEFSEFQEVCEIIKGKKPEHVTPIKNENSSPYILINSFGGVFSSYTEDNSVPKCKSDDILMVMDGARSGLVATGIEGSIGSTLAALRIKNPARFDPIYVYYFLKAQYDTLNKQTKGAAIPHIDKHLLKRLSIPTLSLERQKKTANIITKADRLKQKREQANQVTNKLLQAIFIQMFGDPSFNPKHWETKVLGSLLASRLIHGKSLERKRVNKTGCGLPVLKLSALSENGFDSSQIKYYDEQSSDILTWCLVKDDILISRSNTLELVGRVGRYIDQPNQCIFPDLMIRARPDQRKVDPVFLEYYLRTPFVREFFKRRARGTSGSMPKISNIDIIEVEIRVPPIELQKSFTSIASKVELLEQMQIQSTQTIDKLSSVLMSKAFKGELVS
jgi:type I restriction enzyme S subunit